ncbi:MAG: EAL domain-containing protein [Hyphomicrobiaceae bacterium]
MLFAIAILAGSGLYLAQLARDATRLAGFPQLEVLAGLQELKLAAGIHRELILTAIDSADGGPGRAGERVLLRMKGIAGAISEHAAAGAPRNLSASLSGVADATGTLLASMREHAGLPAAAAVARYDAATREFQSALDAAMSTVGRGATTGAGEVLAEKVGKLGAGISAVALIAMLGLMPIGSLLVHGLTQRLRAVRGTISRLALRQQNTEVHPSGRSDELAELERAVVAMKSNSSVLQRQKSRLEQLNLWLDVALNNMTRGLSMFDAEQRLVVSNGTYQRMYELPDAMVEPGTHFADIIRYRQQMVETLNGEQLDTNGRNPEELASRIANLRTESHSTFVLRRGSVLEVSIKPLPQGGWVALHEDVTERRRDAEQISQLARRDALTGLANRFSFREALDEKAVQLPAGRSFALHCIDLDRFKEVNDTLGHPCGDEVLRAVAMRLDSAVRGGDIVGRLGGDEFAVIQVGARSQSDAAALGNRLLDRLSAPYVIQGHHVEIGATIGIALAPGDADSPDSLLKCGDMALYRAKADGRGRLHFYDCAMEGEIRERRNLEMALQKAIENNELELHYQPIMKLGTREVSGCEALIRWRHPERGLVSPAQFIPLAEETGLIIPIGKWAIETACREAVRWPNNATVAVNLSAAQFASSDLVEVARAALQDSGLAAERLELEVTESLILETSARNQKTLHSLRDLGVRIALDDFGTGYSSLSYLRSFPFDKIKIDQTFVRDISERKDCVAIVGAVAQLAASLSMSTVAEGVETGDHLTRVQAAGCTEAQGYLFSRPVPAQQIIEVMARCNMDMRVETRAA